MYGRTYIEINPTLDAYRKRCMDIHLKKLSEIKKLGVVKKNDDAKKVELSIKRMHDEKIRTHEFLKQERDLDINRGNKKLLEKLVEISKGKHLSVEPLASLAGPIQPNHHSSTTSALQSFRPKSLNVVVRKREIQQIEQDNFKFAKRLFESQGEISVKDHKLEFRNHQKLVENMQKLKKKASKTKLARHGMLPPLRPSDKSAPTVTGDQGRARSKQENDALSGDPVNSIPQTERLPELRESDMRKNKNEGGGEVQSEIVTQREPEHKVDTVAGTGDAAKEAV
ncbi:hypothetical protein FGO68_gene5669 [Halteria grandinella]|uniref:Uncharacterized protein n=1 Tax=Halteria grandinella TaxID=5974 RepID=A0A8J8ND54_HALGN|nr:hypothetical protein FGO68_gene5669 [Halteria grandinella]